MPRYIDADALEKEMLFWSDTYGYGGLTKDNIREIIKSSPTADVAEVIRCKECSYHELDGNGDDWCVWSGNNIKPTDFCSMGERRTDDDRNG